MSNIRVRTLFEYRLYLRFCSMHYIEVYFSQQHELGVSPDSSTPYISQDGSFFLIFILGH